MAIGHEENMLVLTWKLLHYILFFILLEVVMQDAEERGGEKSSAVLPRCVPFKIQ